MEIQPRAWQKLSSGLKNKKFWLATLIIVIVAGLVSGGITLTVHQANVQHQQQQARLALLAKQQKAQASKSQPVAAHQGDVSDAVFTDVSATKVTNDSCGRLQNRPGIVITDAGCDYRLKALGNIDVAIVFVYQEGYSSYTYDQLASSDPTNVNSLAYANTFYKQQAARYNVANPVHLDMTQFGPFKIAQPVLDKDYFTEGASILPVFQDAAKANNVPTSDYDAVEYVLLDKAYGGEAFPNEHQNFSYSLFDPAVFTHETLHLFGATDKYVATDSSCKSDSAADPFQRYNGTVIGVDIMCQDFNFSTATINDITAREIGWAN